MKKSLKRSIGAAVLCCVASLVSTASAQNGVWTAYPGQAATYGAAVQQPINTDGTSKFKANGNAVIPVKFALTQATGPFVFESIGSDASTDNDWSYLSFAPNTPVTFNDITELSAVFAFTEGNCHGGSVRWQVRVDLGDGTTPAVFIYYGDYPNFTGTTNSQSNTNMIGMSDLCYDTSQIPGGTFYDSYAHAQTLVGNLRIIRASLVLDGGWAGDQRVSLTSATVATAVFSETLTPQETSPTPICPTREALFGFTKVGASPTGPVNEAMTIQPQDNNGIFRIVNGKYMYNLATSSLMGAGKYNVYATIDGTTFFVAGFELK